MVEDQLELVCSYLPDFTLIFVNRAYSEYDGKSKEELIGQSMLNLIAVEDRDMVIKQIQSLSIQNPNLMNEQKVIRKGVKIGWLQWSNRTIHDDLTHITAIFTTSVDTYRFS